MNQNLSVSVCTVLVAAAAFVSSASAAPLPGAIFTTTVDGTVVNANTQYNSKCDVYLDGGPGPNAPAKAAGLPAGDYYFQVTDPSGATLLSTDPVSNRRFTVSTNGVIVAYSGAGGPTHPVGIDQDHPELSAVTIRLANSDCPTDFKDTPNQGGVYKVWVTRTADFSGDPANVDNACGSGCFHGFVPAKSKTDDFKVRASAATFCLTLGKELQDVNGVVTPGGGWEIRLTDPLNVTNSYFTDGLTGQVKVCSLTEGSYIVSEVQQSGFHVVALIVNGVFSGNPSEIYPFSWVPGQVEPVVVFRNAQDVVTPGVE